MGCPVSHRLNRPDLTTLSALTFRAVPATGAQRRAVILAGGGLPHATAGDTCLHDLRVFHVARVADDTLGPPCCRAAC